MFKNAEETLDRILALVAKCPKELQEKCFEILLKGYVDASAPVTKAPPVPPRSEDSGVSKDSAGSAGPAPDPTPLSAVPDVVKPRLVSMAGRAKLTKEQIASLFDFQLDPFNYHALVVPGNSKLDMVRNVILLIGAKAYLATGAWTVDWKEVKAVSVDQNCFDRPNFAKAFISDQCKDVVVQESAVLSSQGVVAAEALLKKLATPTA